MEGTEKTDPGYSAFVEAQRAMAQVIYQMRLTPEPPSEKPKDISPLRRVEFPESGGVMTYMGHVDSTAEVDGQTIQIYKDHPYPYDGFPWGEFVEKIDYIKKTARGILSGLYHQLKSANKLWILTLLPGLWVIKDSIRTFVYLSNRIIDRFKMKPERYCASVRELYRGFSWERRGESEQEKEFRLMLRDVLCMILQFDNAYRFRFQDLMEDFDRESLMRNPAKELIRLLDIMVSREKTQTTKDTWFLLRLFIKYYLRFDRKLLYILRDSLYQVNVNNILLSDGDRYFSSLRHDYNFKFMNK